MTDSPRDKDWKRRYLASLEEFEKKERSWEEKERELRRGISRLSLLGDGRDPGLDDRLEQLRNQVRSEQDIERLRRIIDGITRFAEGLVEKPRLVTKEAPDLAASLRHAIESVSLPAYLEKKAQRLIRELDRESLAPKHFELLKSLLSDLATSRAKDTAEAVADGKPGPISRLFGGSSTQDKADKPSDVDAGASSDTPVQETPSKLEAAKQLLNLFLHRLDASVARSSDLEELLTVLRQAQSQEELEHLVEDLARLFGAGRPSVMAAGEVLLQLLEKLDFPPTAEADVESLRVRLRGDLAPDKLGEVIEALVGLLTRIRELAEHERQDVEGFLRQLTLRLQELDAQLGGADAQGRAMLEHSRQLGSLVEGEMTGIRNSVDSADDLDELKLDISQRLQKIHQQLERHRADDERRSQEFEQCITGLRDRLGQVEVEADELKKTVAEARAEAFSDALTGINNRLAFDARMKQEYSRWQRYGAPLSLVLLDIDHFKKINDTFGHKAGDKVLQVVGKLLKSLVREVDCPARYGGEEFVVLLPETDLTAAMTVAEKIRQEVERTGFHSRERKVDVTLSAGVAVFGRDDTPESVFERADAALYAAKNGGRNQCRPQASI